MLCAAVLAARGRRGIVGLLSCTPARTCRGRRSTRFENFVYGAPPMAPLLFPNLMVLGIIALWQLRNNDEYLMARS